MGRTRERKTRVAHSVARRQNAPRLESGRVVRFRDFSILVDGDDLAVRCHDRGPAEYDGAHIDDEHLRPPIVLNPDDPGYYEARIANAEKTCERTLKQTTDKIKQLHQDRSQVDLKEYCKLELEGRLEGNEVEKEAAQKLKELMDDDKDITKATLDKCEHNLKWYLDFYREERDEHKVLVMEMLVDSCTDIVDSKKMIDEKIAENLEDKFEEYHRAKKRVEYLEQQMAREEREREEREALL